MAKGEIQKILQLSLFETLDKRQANYVAMFDLAPRFVHRIGRDGTGRLEVIKREFDFGTERYRVTVTPARITDSQGNEKDMLPGEREQLVEDVIRKLAAERLHLGDQDEVLTRFSIYGVQKELAKHNHTFSKAEIREAFQVLHLCNISIMKLAPEGEKRPKPVVSAPAFPVLVFRDESDVDSSAFVQLNPLLAQAIKALAFEQVNYEWMMQLRNPLPRWVFKWLSLLLAEDEVPAGTMEIRASQVINSFGNSRSRWREMLSEVEKSVAKLKEIAAISDYVKADVKEGKKKVDVVFHVRFSERFLADRRYAREQSEFNATEAAKRTGKRTPSKFVPIDDQADREIRLRKLSVVQEAGGLALQ